MPHYMSDGVNQLTADGLDKAINGLNSMLLLTVTGLEEIILFIINLLTSTYVCLITFAVSGSLHVAIDIAEDVGDFLNSTAKTIGHDLGDVVADFDTGFNDFLAGLTDIGEFLPESHSSLRRSTSTRQSPSSIVYSCLWVTTKNS